MSKFKVRLKVTGLELEVEGTRDDVPLIAQSVGQQFSHLLRPAAEIVEGEVEPDTRQPHLPIMDAQPVKNRITRRRASATPSNAGSAQGDKETLDWVHDPGKWGNPQQSWVTSKKSIWLLYVAAHEANTNSMSGKLIANTFNTH